MPHGQKQFIIPLPFEKSNTFLRGTPENVGAKIGKSASAGSLFRQKPIVSCVFPGSGMDRGGLRHISWVHRKPGGAGIPRSPAAGLRCRSRTDKVRQSRRRGAQPGLVKMMSVRRGGAATAYLVYAEPVQRRMTALLTILVKIVSPGKAAWRRQCRVHGKPRQRRMAERDYQEAFLTPGICPL